MSDGDLFPGHIQREEEKQILAAAETVGKDQKSRALLLYGPGGIGKTSTVRELARSRAADMSTIWLDPIDIDDSDYWLLSNLERAVVAQIDPEAKYFGPYLEDLSRLPVYARPGIGHETIVAHLGRIKSVFIDCYRKLIHGSGKSVVMTFDTVETIRGTYLLIMLTQWMKTLPATLFILSGRPLPEGRGIHDPILRELEDPTRGIPVTTVRLGEFTEAAAFNYLDKSPVAAGLTHEEKTKLVWLTRGHPLWLAFTISYLHEKGVPEEAEGALSEIRMLVPFRGAMTPAGQRLHEAFKRRLVSPYREADFWHEADKRLAVVRQSVDRPVWEQLMADLPLPGSQADGDAIWQQLLHRPWIRRRANGRYVTLHDAVAEELAQRIIPLHDQDQQWRRELWRHAVRIYDYQVEGPERELGRMLAAFDARLNQIDVSSGDQGELIQEAALVDARKRDLDRFKVAGSYYLLLSDFTKGAARFLALADQAKRESDVFFRDLLAFEMQRFLPGEVDSSLFRDIVGDVISKFRDWLSADGRETYINIGIVMADYLIGNEQPKAAIELLDRLPKGTANLPRRFRLTILQGNAYMRIPGRVKAGLPLFLRALSLARESGLPPSDQQKLVAEAYKELGFYYRNRGLWKDADKAYEQACAAISETLSIRGLDEDREELASIQTNWAYVKGLSGLHPEGVNLVESAIAARQRLGKRQEEGISWSVLGEIYRYEQSFQKAWESYLRAEEVFDEQRNWYWLGIIYQEQAICLFQAAQERIDLNLSVDPLAEAKRRISRSVSICRDAATRGYPSALNRAGRIFGKEYFDLGLAYLEDGAEQARRLADGWFWFASLVEYVELSYQTWVATGWSTYRDRIRAKDEDIMEAMSEYEFPDLRGRWHVVLGHLAIHDWEASQDPGLLATALTNYRQGFELIAKGGHVGSGTSVIPKAFEIFGGLLLRLPTDVRASWHEELRSAWVNQEPTSTLLLPRLEGLY
jgi:tetratricopeptide (TPR) repeat protein